MKTPRIEIIGLLSFWEETSNFLEGKQFCELPCCCLSPLMVSVHDAFVLVETLSTVKVPFARLLFST